MYYFILRNALYNTSTKDIEINFKANTFREYIEFFYYYLMFQVLIVLFIERQKIPSKKLVQGPGVKKIFNYRVIHQNSLMSCSGQYSEHSLTKFSTIKLVKII